MEIIRLLRENFKADFEKGVLTRINHIHSQYRNVVCGYPHNGYLRFRFQRKQYLVHRVIYALYYNEFPEYVDHIDGNPKNNAISNLRKATLSENMRNSKPKKNISGYKGVTYTKDKMWRARITTDSGRIHLGYFSTKEEAYVAYVEAAKKYHGEFARVD